MASELVILWSERTSCLNCAVFLFLKSDSKNLLCFYYILREFYNDLKYCEDEPEKIGEVFAQSVGSKVIVS